MFDHYKVYKYIVHKHIMSRRQEPTPKAKFIFHMKIPDIEEDILSEEEKKEIEFNIQPIMTGWRN